MSYTCVWDRAWTGQNFKTMDFQIVEQFNMFWQYYQVDERLFPHRRAATLRLWTSRTEQEREAMLTEVRSQGGPKGKNPYFYVQEFTFPEPENLNGSRKIERLVKTTQLVIARYKGAFGTYTLADARRHAMEIVRGLNFKYEPSNGER